MDSSHRSALCLLLFGGIILLNCMHVSGQFTIASCPNLNITSLISTPAVDGNRPYSIVPTFSSYDPGNTYTVFVAGINEPTYTGLIIQARRVNGDVSPVGSFEVPAGFTTLLCSAQYPAGTLTNIDSTTKSTPLMLMWTAPSPAVGDIEFLATIFTTVDVFHENIIGTAIITGPPPTLAIGVCPNDITINVGTVANWVAPTCIEAATTTSICSPAQGQALTQDTTITCSCFDGIGGIQQCAFQIIVIVPIPLAIGDCPNDLAINAGTVASWATPTCTGSTTTTSTCNPAQGQALTRDTIVTCSCFDGIGGVQRCAFQIIVIATTVLQCPVDVTTNDGTAVQYTNPACGVGFVPPMAICSPAASAVFQIGATTVSCSCFGATTETCQFDVNVIATTGLQCPADVTANDGTAVQYANPACGVGFVPPMAICSPAASAVFQIGATTVSCSCFGATTETCQFNVNVIDLGSVCLNNPCFGNECRQSITSSAGYTCHSTQGSPCF